MKNDEKGSVAIILAAIIVLAAIAGAGYFVLRDSGNESVSDVYSSSGSQESKQTSGNSDNDKKIDAAKTNTELNNYLSNNNGKLPTIDNFSEFVNKYMSEVELSYFEVSSIKMAKNTDDLPDENTLLVYVGAKCSNSRLSDASKRESAVGFLLSSGEFDCF